MPPIILRIILIVFGILLFVCAMLSYAGKKLKEGTTKLADGSTELADGMEEFDEEGIQKISDLAGDNLTALMDRLDAVTEADKDYTAFDGWKKDADGSVKFIIETAAIK